MRVGTSNATLGGNPMVEFHALQGVEEVNLGVFAALVAGVCLLRATGLA